MARARKSLTQILSISLACISLSATPCRAFWPSNGRLVAASSSANFGAIVTDGARGGIVAWTDQSIGAIFARHLLSNGELDPAWPSAGVRLTSLPGGGGSFQFDVVAAPDSAGGAYIAWHDDRASVVQVYVTRVNAAGALAPGWPAAGLQVSSIQFEATYSPPVLVADDSGGAYVAWEQNDQSAPSDVNLYASRLNAGGSLAPGWQANGNPACDIEGNQRGLSGEVDGLGGLLLAWSDYRSNSAGDLYATRLTREGVTAAGWVHGGVAVSTNEDGAADAHVVPDGSGGAVLAYRINSGSLQGVVASHLTAAGVKDWLHGGTILSIPSASFPKESPAAVSDGVGGAFVAWQRGGDAGDLNIEIARVTATGARAWPQGFVSLCAAPGDQAFPALQSDGRGGAIATWADARASIHWDIYAQGVDSTGTARWPIDGIAVCASHSVTSTTSMAPDGQGGALILWDDARTDFESQGVYAARVNAAGVTGPTPVAVGGASAIALRGTVELRWSAFTDRGAVFRVLRASEAAGPYAATGDDVVAKAGGQDLSFVDRGVQPRSDYFYRLTWREDSTWLDAARLEVRTPAPSLALRTASASPASGAVRFQCEVDRAGRADLRILDARGSCVRRVFQRELPDGVFDAAWDGRDDAGREVPAGIYFARLATAGGVAHCKVARIR